MDTIKSLLKQKSFRLILILEGIALAFLLISLISHYRAAQIVTPPLNFWQSRMISYEDGWHMTGQFYSESGYERGQYTEIIYGPFISLPKGDYTLRIDYACDADQTFRVYAFEQEDKIEAQDPEVMHPGSSHARYHYTVTEDTENLEVRIDFNGLGDIHIYDISLATGYWEQWRNLCGFLILFVLLDLVLALLLLSKKPQVSHALLSLLTTLALCIDPAYNNATDIAMQITGMFKPARLLPFLLFVFCYLFYRSVQDKVRPILSTVRGMTCTLIPAGLFTLCLLFGYSYQETDSWDLVFNHHLQPEKSFIALIGLFILISHSIALLYAWADGLHRKGRTAFSFRAEGIIGKYLALLRRKPFLTAFITLLVINLPYMITAYPGISTGDTADQILQAFQIQVGSSESVRLLSDQMMINQHHPVMHTMLMHVCLLLGIHVFHSANIGIAIVSILQTLAVAAAISYLAAAVAAKKPSDLHLLFLMIFFAFSPRLQSYLFVLTKDIFYGALLLFSIVLLWKLLQETEVRTGIFYALSLIGMIMLRNDAVYTILIQLIILLIACKKSRKVWLCSLAAVLAVYLLFTRLIWPSLDISASTVNEALSIPVQQTARYLRDYPGDVTPEEAEAIGAVWSYKSLAEKYDPTRSDGTKGTYRLQSTTEDLLSYLKAWAAMFFRHPGPYFQATLNNYYEYYYPGVRTADNYSFDHADGVFEYVNTRCKENNVEGMNLHWPDQLKQARLLIEKIRESVFSLPFLSVLLSVACYSWAMVTSLFYFIRRKNSTMTLLLMPLFLVLLVCLAGPCNGSYFRYFYPIALCLPAALFLFLPEEEETAGS